MALHRSYSFFICLGGPLKSSLGSVSSIGQGCPFAIVEPLMESSEPMKPTSTLLVLDTLVLTSEVKDVDGFNTSLIRRGTTAGSIKPGVKGWLSCISEKNLHDRFAI